MKTIDARGQACPRPLIMTKQALKETLPGEKLRIIIDNDISCGNVERFLADNGLNPESREEGGIFTIEVETGAGRLSRPDAESYCAPASSRPHAIVFSSNRMGQGSDELGEVLMKGLVNIIAETSPLPSHLIFYNSGILLTSDGSNLIESLREIEGKGVKILVCGTCVKHYGKENSVGVGTISNMYTILETMTAAGHIIKP